LTQNLVQKRTYVSVGAMLCDAKVLFYGTL